MHTTTIGRVAALPLGRMIWARHRFGLLALFCICVLWAVGTFLSPDESVLRRQLLATGSGLALPLSLLYLVPVFAYGFDGIAIEARSSAFPARQLTLPVSTVALVAWPMLSGGLTMMLTWLGWNLSVLKPNNMPLPLWWPALALATGLAWLQALLWTPFSLPYLRVFVLTMVGTVLVVLAFAGVYWEVGEPILAGVFAGLFLLAGVVAYRALVVTRRGDVPEWSWPFEAPLRCRAARLCDRLPFQTPTSAQFWFEQRRHLWAFPFLLGFMLLCATVYNVCVMGPHRDVVLDRENLLAKVPFTREAVLMFLVFGWVLMYPPFFAGPSGNDLGGLGSKEQYASFLLTRPLTSGELIVAKLRVATRSVLLGFAMLSVAVLVWVFSLGIIPDLLEWWRQVEEFYHPLLAWAMVPLAVVGLGGLTWLQFCKGMPLGLLGRVWSYWVIALYLGPITVLSLIASSVLSSADSMAQFWSLVPWLVGALAVAAVLKLLLVAWVLQRVVRQRLWPPRVLGSVLSLWVVTVSCLLVLLWCLVPAEVVPVYQLAPAVVVVTPLTRLVAAPLILEWVRHR
jgi:hypothetical protein